MACGTKTSKPMKNGSGKGVGKGGNKKGSNK